MEQSAVEEEKLMSYTGNETLLHSGWEWKMMVWEWDTVVWDCGTSSP